MKTRFFSAVAALLLCSATLFAEDNYLSVAQAPAIVQGATSTLTIDMANTATIVNFQFDLTLPQGISVAMTDSVTYSCTLSNRADASHSIVATQLSATSYRFVCVTGSNIAFSGTSGALLSIGLEAAEDATVGQQSMSISNITLATPGSVKYRPANVASSVFVNAGSTDVEPTDVSTFDYVIYADSVKGSVGGSATININLKNATETVRGVDFVITLPVGVSFRTVEGEDNYEFTPSSRYASSMVTTFRTVSGQPDNTARVSIASYSSTTAKFSGTEGTILSFPVTISNSLQAGKYAVSVSEAEMSDGTNVTTVNEVITSIFRIFDYVIGDGNGDGRVSVTDILMLVDAMYGSSAASFNDMAADVDGNGRFTVNDILKIVDIMYSNN